MWKNKWTVVPIFSLKFKPMSVEVDKRARNRPIQQRILEELDKNALKNRCRNKFFKLTMFAGE